MRRLILTALVVASCGIALPADDKGPVKDSTQAALTRKRLKVKVSVKFTETMLKEAFEEINSQLDDASAGQLSFKYDLGVSMNQRISFTGDKVAIEEALDGMLKKNGLGYVVISKPKDRYDGFILIKQGAERGYPKGEEPKDKDKK